MAVTPPTSELQKQLFDEKNKIRALWFDPNLSSPQNQQFANLLLNTLSKSDFELHLCTSIPEAIEILQQGLFKWWKIITSGSEGRALISKIKEFQIERKHFLTLIVYCQKPEEHRPWALEDSLTLGVQAILGREKVATSSQQDILLFLKMSPSPDKMLSLVSDDMLPKVAAFPDFSAMVPKVSTGQFLRDQATTPTTPSPHHSQNRQNRYIQYVLPMSHIPVQLANCLFCPESIVKSPPVSTIMGILIHARMKGYPMSDITNMIRYSAMDIPATVMNPLAGWTLMGAYTEESFLYKDLNRALAECDFSTLKRLRWFLRMLYSALIAKVAPYYAGVVYRAVNMGKDIDTSLYFPGNNIFFTTFASTTKSLALAQEWGCDTLFEIHTCDAEYQEKNTFCHTNVDLKDVTRFPKEEEVLYPPFSMFLVSGIESKYGTRVIVLKESTGTAWNFLYCHIQFGVSF